MTPEKLISIVEMYEAQLAAENVPKVRMNPSRYFEGTTKNERLAHAHYLCEGAKEYARDPLKQDKANRHLASIQMCLGFGGVYTLEELMEHNRPKQAPARRQFTQGITNFREPSRFT